MLPLLLALSMHTAPAEVVDRDERNDLFVFATALGGASFLDVDSRVTSGGLKGPVLGVRAGVHGSRPPIASQGGRLGFMSTLLFRYEPLSTRAEWVAEGALTVTLFRWFMLATGVGYGLSSVSAETPRHFLQVSTQLVFNNTSGFWVGAAMDVALRFDGGRTLQGTLTAGWQFEVLDF